ncbi:MAG: cache domain-containing protein, partial [Candidatus Zixiibacteriota bacterium]
MRIQHKLISSLVGATLLIGVVGYISVERSQQALEEGVRRSAIRLALSSMNKIEDEIKRRIESFEEYTTELILQKAVKKSNREFDRLEDREAYIDRQDELWIKLAPYSTTSLMSELLVNELSHELIEKVDFLKERHGYPVIRDVVVTNRYGATVALTDRIADYRQDDDRWWKSVRDSGLYVSVHEHDLQDGIYSADVGIRVNDSVGEFIGAMEVVMSAGQIVSGVRELSAKTDYESARYTLVDTAGVVIYDESGEYDHLSDISETEFFRYLVGDYGYQGGAPGIISRGDDNVCAYALMTGIGGAGDIGWILAIQFDAAEVFGPALELRRVIIGIT